jgi:polyketide biosynthesis 3-hydroxy-3-methylglutaryl-CoA synthase-like enzyme PksG
MTTSTRVGIEAINAYVGRACIDIRALFELRGLNLDRFDNLQMHKKTVALPCEDAVTNAVNAAKPIIDALTPEQRDSIEVVIAATESGVDFGKSISTYVHDYLGLNRRCRMFEIKQACYGGTAALQMAAGFIAANPVEGARALVIATDSARAMIKGSYAEPSQATVGVAMLVSCSPEVLELELGASGCYGYEVMDACRPTSDTEEGDPQLTLYSYLDCLEGSFQAYLERVEGANLLTTFDYLVFHTPFVGMVKGAHRKLLRRWEKLPLDAIEADFARRVVPSLGFCSVVGNGYSASLYLALCGLLSTAVVAGPARVGLYSYGSGCSSEFYSGIVSPHSASLVRRMDIAGHIAQRLELDMQRYDELLTLGEAWRFGTVDREMALHGFEDVYEQQFAGRGLLVLERIEGYHRKYRWS